MDLREQSQEREIDGVTYQVWPLPFGAGKKLLMRAWKILGPMAAAGSENAALAMQALTSGLSEADLDYFAEKFSDCTMFKGPDGAWCPLVVKVHEIHFAGRYDAYLAWLMFGVECNFGRFFGGALVKSAAAKLTETIKAHRGEAPTT